MAYQLIWYHDLFFGQIGGHLGFWVFDDKNTIFNVLIRFAIPKHIEMCGAFEMHAMND